MFSARIFFATALLILPLTSLRAAGAQDLETAFEAVIEQLNSKDLEGFVNSWHLKAVVFVYDYLLPVDLEDAGRQVWSPG